MQSDDRTTHPFSRQAWDASTSARAYNPNWWHTLTPDKEPGLWAELRAVFDEEMALPAIPAWACDIIDRMFDIPMCGYYAFPANVTQIIEAIAAERAPDVVLRCYTVDAGRKVLLSYYVFCLDAWSKEAPLEVAGAEMALRDSLGKDWAAILAGIYRVLGERTEIKKIVVERLIHRLRWWIKSLINADDKRDRFGLDVYSGDIRGDVAKWGCYGNPPFGDPYFAELQLPHIQAMEARILAEVPTGKKLLERLHSTWLCAPKAFRYLEKLIEEIGAIGQTVPPSPVEPFLQCEDTYPDFGANARCFDDLLGHLAAWLDSDEKAMPSLGSANPVKHWLIHLLRHKLIFLSRYETNVAKLVGREPHGRSGLKKPSD